MKVLAIRGKNLASLAGEFAIDFQKEPLASAGLYAIAGPTGAGKSTLLDALCLALYERTPRLSKAMAKGESVPDVGEHSISPADPRNVLRRGTADGYAEVDFVGSEGIPYRARWSVRRARGKADGKLQSSEITLHRIDDGRPVGEHTKSATLARIEAAIGLNFDQFTRAVLLAQNDFANFLRAPDDERAELLQTLTGTHAFSDLSRSAFARMKLENEALARLQQQLQDQQPLPSELRAKTEADLRAQQATAVRLQMQKDAIEQNVRWYQQDALHRAELQLAQQQLERALAQDREAAGRHSRLRLLERVQAVRPEWQEFERLQQVLQDAAVAAVQAEARVQSADQQARADSDSYAAAKAQTQQAEADRLHAQPALASARALDLALDRWQSDYAAAQAALAVAQAQLHTARGAEADNAQQRAAAAAAQSEAQQWLASHAGLRTLAEGWQRWEAILEQARDSQIRQAQLAEALRRLAAQSGQQAEALEAARDHAERAALPLVVAEQALDAVTQAYAAMDAGALAREKNQQEALRELLQNLAQHWQQQGQLQTQIDTLRSEQATQAGRRNAANAELAECVQSLPMLEAAAQAAEQALQRAALAAGADAETLRAQLQADQPCPVCGALAHPYAGHAPLVDSVMQALQDNLHQQRTALRAVQDRAARAEANGRSAGDAVAAALQTLSVLERSLAESAAASDALLAGSGWHDEVQAMAVSGRRAWYEAQRLAMRERWQQLQAREARLQALLQEKNAAQQLLNQCRDALGTARNAQHGLEQQLAHSAAAHAAAGQQLAECMVQTEALCGQLDAAFSDAGWRQQWGQDAEAFGAQCRHQALGWQRQQQRGAEAAHRLESLALQRSALALAVQQAAQQCADQQSRCAALAETGEQQQRQRAMLLDGAPVASVEARLAAAVHSAQTQLEAASLARQASHAAAVQAQALLRQIQSQRSDATVRAAPLEAAILQWLAQCNADAERLNAGLALAWDDLAKLLHVAVADITRERLALQALRQAVAAADAVCATRSQSLAAHAAARTTEETEEALNQALIAVRQSAAETSQAVSALQVVLARDDERLQASRDLREQIEHQTGIAHVWSQLGELIGSADGKKFRNFAQQLTLDALLAYGNRHLQNLSSRYRVERIKDSLGLLVVDQDMGDELRSVHSLSGGESFLVSLAMALGLASLSSHRVRVASLFIDEGFGSLDADALRVAMDALDSLQAQGRTVGVISHVHEMTERIATQVCVQRQAGGLSQIVVR